jgi:transcriptional regulator with XRE-family HTH domain
MRKVRSPLPLRVTEALATLGTDLKNLRARRRMPMAYAADRVSISRSTLHKVERGDPNVSLGIYAALLHSYGMLEQLESLAEARWDRTGLALEESRLPQRIHS